MSQAIDRTRPKARNTALALLLFGVAGGMVGLTFASVPLYRLFCQVTGFGGTTQVAERLPDSLGGRDIRIRFNADVSPELPWRFQPEVREISLRLGQEGLVFYRAKSLSSHPSVGTATFNVTPLDAGQYFNKVQCFCFDEQRLAAGEELTMGVSFFVDPALEDDPALARLETITLSYTFFRALDDPDASAAGEQSADEPPAEAARAPSIQADLPKQNRKGS